MRDEELAKVPESIEAWKIREFLEGLGITHKNAFDLHVGARAVELSVWASDEKGMRYAGVDGKTAAQHRISIPLVGSWEKPADLGIGILCQAWRHTHEAEGAAKYRMSCDRFDGHTGDHNFTRNVGRVPETCSSRKYDWPENTSPVCERPLGHEGEHRTGTVVWSEVDPKDDEPCPAYLTLGPDDRSNCERAAGHAEDHASHVGGTLQRW